MKRLIREIEVKARLKNKKTLFATLKRLGVKLSKPITQKDTVFLKKGVTYEKITPGVITLRIREQDKNTLFTLKQRQEVELSSLEKETEIKDKQPVVDMIEILGFYEALKINKIRRKAKYKKYEICIDEVEKLGSFIEIEKLTDEDSFEVQEELFKFLETLGINRSDREKRGYDTLIYHKTKRSNPKSKTSNSE